MTTRDTFFYCVIIVSGYCDLRKRRGIFPRNRGILESLGCLNEGKINWQVQLCEQAVRTQDLLISGLRVSLECGFHLNVDFSLDFQFGFSVWIYKWDLSCSHSEYLSRKKKLKNILGLMIIPGCHHTGLILKIWAEVDGCSCW